MASNWLGLKTTAPSVDSRGPQEKGKPAATTSHKQAVGSGTAGATAEVPNRSGSVRSNMREA